MGGKSKVNTFSLYGEGWEAVYTGQVDLKFINSYNIWDGKEGQQGSGFSVPAFHDPPWFHLLFHPWVTTMSCLPWKQFLMFVFVKCSEIGTMWTINSNLHMKAWKDNRQGGQGTPNGGNRLQVSCIFISLLGAGGNKLQVSDFFPSLYKIKRRFLLKFCVAIRTPGFPWT